MKTFAMGLLGSLIALAATLSFAQASAAQTVSSVRVVGLERVSEQLVRSKLEVQAGQPYDARAVSRDIRRLYELGFFTTIRAEANETAAGLELAYVVEEKRVIDEVRIIGNDKLRDRRVRAVLSWREGDSFIADGYDQEREAILNLYAEKGYANTTVDIMAEKVGPSRVRITYVIDEGRKARIRDIDFVGNETLTDRELRKLIETKRAWWILGGRYDETKFETDLSKIIDEYGNYGRLEADVPKADLVFTETGKGMNITVFINEGPEYTVNRLDVANNVVYDDDEVLNIVEVEAGQVHNKGQVEADAGQIEKGYQDSGYVDASVTPQVILDRENKTTEVVHNVEEGDLKYLREIKISGNEVTKDEVIRRRIMLKPGDRFDGGQLELSQRALENSGYFETTRFSVEDVADRALYNNLLVNVEEGDTGNFNFGAGYNTESGIGGFGELKLSNFDLWNWPTFSGGGQQFSARIDLGSQEDSYSLSFTDPEFMGNPFSLGLDLFNQSFQVRGGADYTEAQTGAQIRLGKALSPFTTTQYYLRYSDNEVSDLPFGFLVNPRIRRLSDDGAILAPGFAIERDTTNSRYEASSGARHTLQTEVATGDFEWYKVEHNSIWYKALGKDQRFILSYRTREGIVTPFGETDNIPLGSRLYAGGGTTVRGYDARDIGPKVREGLFWGDYFRIGGEARLIQNLELKIKYRDLLRFYTFVDAGGVWEEVSDIDLGDMKYGAGIGIGVDVPRLGPIRLDYGFALNPDDDQDSGRFHLQSGVRF